MSHKTYLPSTVSINARPTDENEHHSLIKSPLPFLKFHSISVRITLSEGYLGGSAG